MGLLQVEVGHDWGQTFGMCPISILQHVILMPSIIRCLKNVPWDILLLELPEELVRVFMPVPAPGSKISMRRP